MSAGWWLVIVLGGILIWAIYISVSHSFDERLAMWWVARARRWGQLTAPFSFAISAAAMLFYSLLLGIGAGLTAEFDNLAWALCFMLPQTLLYAPFMLITVPTRFGYPSWRSELHTAGASTRQQRQIAWWAGPPSMMGMAAMIGTGLWLFLP